MNVRHSTAIPFNEYQPTIIESRLLLNRLAREIEFLKNELNRAWDEFNDNPKTFISHTFHELSQHARAAVSKPHAVPATLISLFTIASIVTIALLVDRTRSISTPSSADEIAEGIVILDVSQPKAESKRDHGIGMDGKGRVGFQKDKGEGSGATPKQARGGGGGGDGEPGSPQVGKLPPPSPILAVIPKAPPLNPPSLPAAGIDIDPALWKDLKAPVYGDPRSNSDVPSKGPGHGGGFGTNEGLGIGEGNGPGFGPGEKGNMGGGSNEAGCCGGGGGPNGSLDRPFVGSQVEQRARLLSKPEPQYTDEARKNQITGTVTLRVIFSSAGEVVQIRAVNTLPFGLTERAIAAARQIKFLPAMKGGQPVSVFMQLEYNFHLY
jgi:protein TonB